MAGDVSLQVDMFTGEQVDTRSNAQKKADAARHEETQLTMFSHREAPIGVLKVKPIVDISHLPSPPLILEKKDVRTEEEKTIARRHAMEDNTVRMFTNDPTLYREEEDHIKTSTDEKAEEQDSHNVDRPIEYPQEVEYTSKESAYRDIIMAAREKETTEWVDRLYAEKLALHLPNTVEAARREGLLTDSEISCALQIGQDLAHRDKNVSHLDVPPAIEDPSKLGQPPNADTCRPKGLRAQLRRTSTNLRAR